MFVQYQDSKIELPEGSKGYNLADKLNLRDPSQALAIVINGTTCDTSHPLKEGDEVSFWNFEDPEGKEIFWHSSAHVLAQAVLRLYPDAEPTIGPPIENGFYYDFANLSISVDDFKKIEKEIQKVLSENLKPEKTTFKGKEEALKEFASNPYKCELIKEFDASAPITAYRQGEFFDLCRGPHLSSLSKIKAFKLMKTSGAYWRGDSDREMLTRIYGISFPDRKQLKSYVTLLEEAKKRDHRIIGQKLDLFSFHEDAPGMPFIHHNGTIMWNNILAFWREIHQKAGYLEIQTPQMMSRELWVKSGHWEHYRENMFTSQIENKDFAIKPMNCPGCMIYYAKKSHSYREFPLRIAEIGHVHRYEPSGAINGLLRVRSFHQDDAHIFMTPSQIKDEILRVFKLTDELYAPYGLTYRTELSTRPEKSIGTDEEWENATNGLHEALKAWGKPFRINEGDGAFYGPKIDLHITDALGRNWQCGTIQLDMSLPERFDLEYTESDGSMQRPVMIHRALYGSVERFFAIIIEHFAGKFPLWLSPQQVRIIPVADRHHEYAHTIANALKETGFLCDVDDTNESVSKKVRNAQLQQTNYMLTVGDQELEKKTISLRTRDNVVHGEVDLAMFLTKILEERDSRSLTSSFAKE